MGNASKYGELHHHIIVYGSSHHGYGSYHNMERKTGKRYCAPLCGLAPAHYGFPAASHIQWS